LDENNRVLLFHFFHKHRAFDRTYWATPGGAVEEGETLEQAAQRELYEETGFHKDDIGKPIWHNEFIFKMDDGESVIASENFFVVQVSSGLELSHVNWTLQERELITEHKWWSIEQLDATTEVIYPENLISLLEKNSL